MNQLERFPETKPAELKSPQAQPPQLNSPEQPAPNGLRVAAIVLRTAFICIMVVVVLRVAMPQNETIWTVYDTAGDLVRLLLGVIASIWLLAQLFAGPSEAHGYRTWLYLGLTAIPLSLIFLHAIW